MTRRERGETLFNHELSELLGKAIRNGTAAREILEQAEILNHFGPCCDTTMQGKEFIEGIQNFIVRGVTSTDRDGDIDERLNQGIKTTFERYVFNASNQYLVYQRHKELKEERATWHNLYTQQLRVEHEKSQTPINP